VVAVAVAEVKLVTLVEAVAQVDLEQAQVLRSLLVQN
jgi:hypothetical protein